MTIENLLLFVVTTALACFTPGPAAMLVASVGTSRSRQLVALTILGIASANVLLFALSATGIAGLLLASKSLYAVIRWLGAGYLVYLGGRLFFAKAVASPDARPFTKMVLPAKAAFTKSFMVEISNPKALLYFSSLLPQFITSRLPLLDQFVTFCLITIVLDLLAYSAYGALGFGIAERSAPSLPGAVRRLAGVAFVLAGVRLVGAG